jgi:hypothetical protein
MRVFSILMSYAVWGVFSFKNGRKWYYFRRILLIFMNIL